MSIENIYELYLAQGQLVSTDSRNITPGCLFFALKGPNFNGNQFAEAALKAGAAYAIIDEEAYKKDDKYILVDKVLDSLQQLARQHRRQFDIPIIAITGSNGKTTTKELIANILKTHYDTHFTQGNLNNHIGVPLSLLSLKKKAEIAIIEMGANHQGEIHNLCQIAEPSHGLITNIGKAHLEGFGGIEGVKKGKSELYRYLEATKGTAFVNLEEKFLQELSVGISKRIFYQKADQPDLHDPAYQIQLLSEHPLIKVAYLDKKGILIDAQSHLFGIHNFNNIMTAVCLGQYFKVPVGKIKYAIENYIPTNNRSQMLQWRENQLILDAYNANPSSTEKALSYFAAAHSALPKLAILGDMLELGSTSEAEHHDIAQLAVNLLSSNQVILVGKHYESVAKQLKLPHFPDVQALKKWFLAKDYKQHFILLKASRGISLEKLL